MNGFKKHGLTHTSPSSINMWEDCPAAWIAKYLYGKSFSFGVAAQIGVLTEKVVADTLTGAKTHEEALKLAKDEFKRKNALNTSEKDLARIGDIEAMSTLAIEELKQYGEPDFTEDGQHKIELNCKGDGWELPVIGYTDFVYPKHGLVVDLKTTLRMPSVMSDAHNRQGAIYKKAMGNKAMKFLYVTPKKSCWHEVEDENPWLAQIKAILNRQEKALRLDAEALKDIMPVSMSSFYWMGDERIRKELYGV